MEDKNNIIGIHKSCGEKRLKEFQKTFNKEDIKVGNFVKKAFEDKEEVEHLWVIVDEIYDDGIKGYIDNEVILLKNIKYKDYVKIKFEEVEDWLD